MGDFTASVPAGRRAQTTQVSAGSPHRRRRPGRQPLGEDLSRSAAVRRTANYATGRSAGARCLIPLSRGIAAPVETLAAKLLSVEPFGSTWLVPNRSGVPSATVCPGRRRLPNERAGLAPSGTRAPQPADPGVVAYSRCGISNAGGAVKGCCASRRRRAHRRSICSRKDYRCHQPRP